MPFRHVPVDGVIPPVDFHGLAGDEDRGWVAVTTPPAEVGNVFVAVREQVGELSGHTTQNRAAVVTPAAAFLQEQHVRHSRAVRRARR